MKKSLLALTLGLHGHCLLASPVTLDVCQAGHLNYSKFWGQEYTGADLVRSEVEADKQSRDLSSPTLAIFDLGFEAAYTPLTRQIDVPPYLNGRRKMTAHHGTMVANLIGGPYPYGVSSNHDLVYLGAVAVPLYAYHIRQFQKSGEFPKVISNSVGWSNTETNKLTEITDEQRTLWFLAAGNDHPNPVAQHEINSKAMLIGALAPNGLQSLTSQTHPDVLALSPGNEELASINGKGEQSLFGGTSGATPLVAGNALNVASYLPNITSTQYHVLIEKTAWPSVENILGQKDAPGILNGYLAFKVAKRISEHCDRDNDTCIEEMLENPPTFEFKQSDPITCDDFKSMSCDQKSEALPAMRKSVFLGSTVQAKHLACAYREIGLSENAKFYNLIATREIDQVEYLKEAIKAIEAGRYESPYYRYQSLYQEDFSRALRDSDQFDDYQKKEILSYGKTVFMDAQKERP